MNDSMTIPLSTATPDNAMKPTAVDMDKGRPRSVSAAIPPVSTSGTPVNTIAASLAELNVMNNKPKMISSVSGTTTLKRRDAEMSCSNVQP